MTILVPNLLSLKLSTKLTKLISSSLLLVFCEINIYLFIFKKGKHLLAWAQTFTDKTGQSYYGEHMLLYLDVIQQDFQFPYRIVR